MQTSPALVVAPSPSDPSRLVVTGELDAYSASILRDALREAAAEQEGDVVLDASAVEFIDSAALGVFIGTSKALEPQGRRLRIVEPSKPVAKLLELTWLTDRFC